jgi:SWI/SNF-related matrix-associated actin-dependent regulator of chromatin subfamily A3
MKVNIPQRTYILKRQELKSTAHEIRTQKTQRSQAVCALTADRRWCVTGTPLQNDLTDIASLFKFLYFEPLNTKDGFRKYVLARQSNGKTGMENLRSALKVVCLRRTKDAISANLPPRSEFIRYLQFRSDEKVLYDNYKRRLFANYSLQEPSAQTFQALLKLRLICDHGEDLLLRISDKPSISERNPSCTVCSLQLVDSDIQFEGIGCPHRLICAGCQDRLQETSENDLQISECEECSADESTPEAPSMGNFPNYRGPSSKVTALLEAIRDDTVEIAYPPKQ